MNHGELVARIADRTGQPRESVKHMLRELASIVGDELADGGTVAVSRLGTFSPRWAAGGVVRDLSSGRKTAYDGRWVPRFKASTKVRDTLAATTPSYLKDPDHQRAWRCAEAITGDLAMYHGAHAPKDLPADAPLPRAERVCADAFGPAWTQARATFDASTPEEIRRARDYLTLAARARWGVRR